jgi:hypothetical protein
MSNQTELAWAAGFFDGEGSTTAGHYRDRNHLQRQITMSVAQIDIIPLLRFKEAVQGGNIIGPYQQKKTQLGRKEQWRWRTAGKDVKVILDKLWPYLCEPKKVQATEALQRYENWVPTKIEWNFDLPE